jgi:hypothetical protein
MKRIIKKVFYGPSSYTTGGVYERIDGAADVDVVFSIQSDSGYVFEPVKDGGVTGNAFKYKIFYQTGVSGKPLTEVKNGENISSAMCEAVVMGE